MLPSDAMRYRLHRSLALWLGLPGFLFILWSWQDSLTHQAGIFRTHTVTYPPSGDRMLPYDTIAHFHSGLLINRFSIEPGSGQSMTTDAPRLAREPISSSLDPGPTFPAYGNAFHRSIFADIEFLNVRIIFIPHWLILLLYMLVWLSLIAWRMHHMIRLTTLRPLSREAQTDG